MGAAGDMFFSKGQHSIRLKHANGIAKIAA